MKKMVITIYYENKIDRKYQIEKLKLINHDFNSIEIQFFDMNNLPEIKDECCQNCKYCTDCVFNVSIPDKWNIEKDHCSRYEEKK